ncbi:MAG: hypothetical protein ACOY40_02415 [Bacillota bacterium]
MAEKMSALSRNPRSPASLTPVQIIVLGYFIFTLTGTALLSLPFSSQPGVELSFIGTLYHTTPYFFRPSIIPHA